MVKFTLNLDGPLLQLPNKLKTESFDYVGRYQLIGEILKRYYGNTNPRNVLDVGGRGGFIKKLVNAPVTILDEEGTKAEQLEYGDGARMNIADGAYEVVVTSDTLEHIPQQDRKKFISELVRVSSDLVILCAPFSDFGAPKEEAKLQEQYVQLTGNPHRWLKEHAEYQLPKFSETIKQFKEMGYSVISFGHSSLELWRCLMEVNLLSYEMGSAGVHEKLKKINSFYNSVLFDDFAQNSYRNFIVLSKKRTLELKTPQRQLSQESLLHIIRLVNDYFNATLNEARSLPVIKSRIKAYEQATLEMEQRYNQVIHSKSWRYTSVVRNVVQKLHTTKNALLSKKFKSNL